MDVNLLTIGDALAGQTGVVPASSRPEPSTKISQFADVGDEKQLQAIGRQSATTDNGRVDDQRGPVENAPKEFRQTLREKEDSGGLPKAQNRTESEEHLPGSKIAVQPELVQSWMARYSMPVENAKGGSATKIEPKAGRKLAELIANFKNEKSLPITGQAAKSAEVKLLESTEKVQAGLKTVLPEKSQGLHGLKGVPSDSSKSIPAKQAPTDITQGTGKTATPNEKAVAAKVPVNADGKTTNAGKKPAVVEILPVGDTPKTTAPRTRDSIARTHADNGVKTVSAAGKTPAVNTRPPVEPPKSPEILPKYTAVEPGKPVRAVEADTAVRASGFEKVKETSPPQRKGAIHAENDTVNGHSARKSNAAEVQVDIGQAKDRGTASSSNTPYQEIVQTVSQNSAETQTIANSFSTSGANTKSSDLPGGASSGDVSADVGKQILESIHSSMSQQAAEKQITIRLNPPELGQVFIKLQEQDTQITGVLEVSKAQTRLEIEQALPEITRNLAANGIQVNRIEVVLSVPEQSAEQGTRDALLQDGSFQQHGSSDYGSSENDYETADTYNGLTNGGGYRNIAEFQEMSVSGNSINILI